MKKFKKILSYIFPILVFGLLFALYGFSTIRNSKRKISAISTVFDTENQKFISNKIVDKLLIQKVRTSKKVSKTTINLYKLEQSVLSNPYVAEADVFLTIKGGLKSNILVRKPIARFMLTDASFYIDKLGFKISLSKNHTARVPLVYGLVKNKPTKEVVKLMQIIAEDDFLKKEITDVIAVKENYFMLLVRSGRYEIMLGDLENLPNKLIKLKAFYAKAFTDKTIEQYKKINLQYHNQVVCTKEEIKNGKQ